MMRRALAALSVLALAAAPAAAQEDASDEAPAETAAPLDPAGIDLDGMRLEAPAPSESGDVTAFARALVAYSAQDYPRALTAALAGAGQGDAEAMVLAGLMYERGQGAPVDMARARQWYEEAARQDQTDALIALARLAADSRAGLAPADARDYLRRAGDQGEGDADILLAHMLIEGEGGPPDLARARELLERQAAAGSINALRELAWLELEQGSDEAADRALSLLERAANAGNPDAAYEAGLLWTDKETDDALARAADLFALAASGGHGAGATLYAHALWQGAGLEQDQEAAVEWYRRAAERGDGEGAFYYAVMLYAGAGMEADADAAYYWAQRSVAGDPSAEAGYAAQRQALITEAETRVSAARQAELRRAAEAGEPIPD